MCALLRDRWLKNDPTSSFALEKLMELASAGAIAAIDLVYALMEAVDTCGSDLYLSKAPTVSVSLWRHLAQLLAAMKEDASIQEDRERGLTAALEDLGKVGTTRAWWKRVYFARPADTQEIAALVKSDDTGSVTEALVYRAAVAYELFGVVTPIVRALCSVAQASSSTLMLKPEHLRTFKRCGTPARVRLEGLLCHIC